MLMLIRFISRVGFPRARILQQFATTTGVAVESIKSLRNVGIVAHIDAGKTTTTENMLYIAGEIKSIGRVDTGDTVTDFLPQERERGITINSAIIELKWKYTLISLIDTPGHVDFTIEVERSCRVLDGIVLVIDAVAGVQAQTKTVWRQSKKQSIPAVAFINKMDRDGASFDRALASIKSGLKIHTVPIQLPISTENSFLGVVDLLTMDRLIWDTSSSSLKSGVHPTRNALPVEDPLYAAALVARRRMLEAIAEVDEAFMEVFFKHEENLEAVPIEDILRALKLQCLLGNLVPAICGASLRGKGIQPLLDSIISFLPSPAERPAVAARDKKSSLIKHIPSTSSDLCALAFKVAYDEARGPLVFVRVYSGTLEAGQVIHNSTRNVKERAAQILKVSADDLERIPEIGTGQVACVVGLKKTLSGDTLVVEGGPLQNYILAGLNLPKSVFALAIEPERSSQQEDMEKALSILCIEDPSLHVDVDKESGQTLIRGIGELHLEIVCDKLRRRFNIEVSTGKAYVAFRETLAMDAEEEAVSFLYDKVIGTKRLYAGFTGVITQSPEKNSPTLNYADIKDKLSVEERAALEEAFEGSVTRGVRGFPVVGFDVKITEVERDSHTCSGSIRACISMLLSSLLRSERHCLLEPVMSLEVYLPTVYLGEVLNDLSTKRRGFVKEVKTDDQTSVITGHVPLVTMLGYASSIRSMTQGEGSFSLEYWDLVPVDEVIAKELRL